MLEDENGAKQKVENLFQVSVSVLEVGARGFYVQSYSTNDTKNFSSELSFQKFMMRQFNNTISVTTLTVHWCE